MIDTLMVALLSESDIDAVAGGGGAGHHAFTAAHSSRPEINIVNIIVVQVAIGGFSSSKFNFGGGTLTNVGNTGNFSSISFSL